MIGNTTIARSSWVSALGAALTMAATMCVSQEVSVLVRDEQAPVSAKSWPEGGMASQIFRRAWGTADTGSDVLIDWADPQTNTMSDVDLHRVDLGLFWGRPSCIGGDISPMCTAFHFSDPVAERVWLLFTPVEGQFEFRTPADLVGKTLCMSDAGRTLRWGGAGQGVVEALPADIRRGPDLATCFDLLSAGRVDAVLADEFSGVAQLFEQDLTETVVPLATPAGTQSLHVIASKSHWRATTLIYRFNSGLAALRKSGEYREIVSRHVTQYWEILKGS